MGTPFGTAHETSTPSFSSRKSQCSLRAWCSWTTNRGALVSLRGTLAPGSGVFLKSRLASYSASFLATAPRLGHSGLEFGWTALPTPAEDEPADGHIPGLQLEDEDAFGQPGHPVLDAFDGRREGGEVEHRQRQRRRSGHDQPRTEPSPAGDSAEEITGDWEPDHRGQSEPEAGEVEEEVLQGEDAIHHGSSPGRAKTAVPIQRAAGPSSGIALKTPKAPTTIRSPLTMKMAFMNGPVGPRPSPLNGWLMA